jgi:hypothetical protein
MNRFLLSLTLILCSFISKAADEPITQIKGFAPSYVGQTITVYEIQDYFSMKEVSLASGTVGTDSTFTISFYAKETQKVIIRATNKNKSLMYIQPGQLYDIYLPEKDKYEPYRPNGNNVEVTFFDLDSTEINYKILQFQRWMDEFVSNYYHLKNVKPMEFSAKLDEFKNLVEKRYELSDTNKVKTLTEPERFFSTFVRFSIASLDNIQHAADRNRYEKHDFYLKHSPVEYRNDAYMGYISTFYEKMMPRLSNETNNKVYLALLKSSPTLIMRALGSEYTLINMRVREMVMIKMLSEEFFSKDYPQTNILTVLDSVANHSLFDANGVIARNMIERLTEMVPGGKAPDFVLKNKQGEPLTLASFGKRHVYLHFYDPGSVKSSIELEPLKKLFETYKEDITFVTIYPDKAYDPEDLKEYLETIPWMTCKTDVTNPIWKKYKIETYPSYILIDGFGYVVAAPALGPMPDGQYQTIDKTFFYIKKINDELQGEGK